MVQTIHKIGLIDIITSGDPACRNQSLESACTGLSAERLLEECTALDQFRRRSDNLFERVRALLFLYAIHRFYLPPALERSPDSRRLRGRFLIPYQGYEHLMQRRFEEAIDCFLEAQMTDG